MRIDDYRTFWPEEESPVMPRPVPAPRPRPQRTVQRGTAYMHGIGPHVALYFALGAVLPFAVLVALGLLNMLFALLINSFQ